MRCDSMTLRNLSRPGVFEGQVVVQVIERALSVGGEPYAPPLFLNCIVRLSGQSATGWLLLADEAEEKLVIGPLLHLEAV